MRIVLFRFRGIVVTGESKSPELWESGKDQNDECPLGPITLETLAHISSNGRVCFALSL
jgi:hypothetical protein